MKCCCYCITLVAVLVGLADAQLNVVNFGNGIVYRRYASADTWLESSNSNYGNLDFLIVSKHTGYLKKRSLIKFGNIENDVPSTCNITYAKMYLNYWYAHKASFYSVQQVPFLSRRLQVHQINKDWSETQATQENRFSGMPWSAPYLAINGTDASAHVQDCVPLYTGRPPGYIEFDVTDAVKNWLGGDPNYGLLLWDVTENVDGRDIRFYSRENTDIKKKPWLTVLCATDCSTSSCRQRYPPPPVCPVVNQQQSCQPETTTQFITQSQSCPTNSNIPTVGGFISVNRPYMFVLSAAIVVAFIGLLVFSVLMCYTSYHCGMIKARSLKAKNEETYELFSNDETSSQHDDYIKN